MKFCHKILDFKLSYGENPKSLSNLGSNRYWVVTDTKTDTKTELPYS